MDFCKKFQMDFQHFWLGPKGANNAAEGCSPPQEIEKGGRRAAIFSSNNKTLIQTLLSNLKTNKKPSWIARPTSGSPPMLSIVMGQRASRRGRNRSESRARSTGVHPGIYGVWNREAFRSRKKNRNEIAWIIYSGACLAMMSEGIPRGHGAMREHIVTDSAFQCGMCLWHCLELKALSRWSKNSKSYFSHGQRR